MNRNRSTTAIFGYWLAKQVRRHDRVGDLSRDYCFGLAKLVYLGQRNAPYRAGTTVAKRLAESAEQVRARMQRANATAREMQTLELAVEQWRKGTPAPPPPSTPAQCEARFEEWTAHCALRWLEDEARLDSPCGECERQIELQGTQDRAAPPALIHGRRWLLVVPDEDFRDASLWSLCQRCAQEQLKSLYKGYRGARIFSPEGTLMGHGVRPRASAPYRSAARRT